MICQRDTVRMPAHTVLLAGIPAQLQLPSALCARGWTGHSAGDAQLGFGTSLLRRHLGPQRLHFASASLLTSLVSAGGTRAAEAPQDTKLKAQTPLPQGTALCGDLLWPLPGPVLRRQWAGGLEFPSARGKTAGKAPATLASSDPLVKTFQFLSKDSLQIRFPPRPCWQKHGLWQHRDIACFWGHSDQPTSL